MKHLVSSKQSAFTLVEVLAASVISVIIVTVISLMLASGSRLSTSINRGITNRYDGKVALDYFEQDFITLSRPQSGRTPLTIVTDEVSGVGGGFRADSRWIMFLSRPQSSEEQGALRTVSYRLVHSDPLNPAGSEEGNFRFALYRSVVSLEPFSAGGDRDHENEFASAEDLHEEFWEDYWDIYSDEDGGRVLLDDYLVGNVVDFKVWLNYNESDSDGNITERRELVEDTVSLTDEGLAFDNAGQSDTTNVPVSITVALTIISETGAQLLQAGSGLDLSEVPLVQETNTETRTIPFFVQ